MRNPINELVRRKLQAYFPPEEVEVRVGPTNLSDGDEEGVGMPLFYIPSRRVMQRLDNVVGPMNWQVKYSTPVNRHKKTDAGVEASIGVRDLHGNWVWKGDVSQNTETEAMKGGYSKAVVRAGVHWGIGRYLYFMGDASDQWQDVEVNYGRTEFKTKPDVPAEFRPENDPNQTKFAQHETRELRSAAQGKSVADVKEVWDEEKSFSQLKDEIESLPNQ